MIKFYISYFYQIRNMKSNMLPVSTAMWDPKWFHNGKGENYRYMDKNGVVNGIRMNQLCMEMYIYEQLIKNSVDCGEHCPGIEQCQFMQEYAKCIREKNPDFQKFISFCDRYIQYLNQRLNLCLDTIIFIVYEAPSRGCGERPELQRWFAENGFELLEWSEELC